MTPAQGPTNAPHADRPSSSCPTETAVLLSSKTVLLTCLSMWHIQMGMERPLGNVQSAEKVCLPMTRMEAAPSVQKPSQDVLNVTGTDVSVVRRLTRSPPMTARVARKSSRIVMWILKTMLLTLIQIHMYVSNAKLLSTSTGLK